MSEPAKDKENQSAYQRGVADGLHRAALECYAIARTRASSCDPFCMVEAHGARQCADAVLDLMDNPNGGVEYE